MCACVMYPCAHKSLYIATIVDGREINIFFSKRLVLYAKQNSISFSRSMVSNSWLVYVMCERFSFECYNYVYFTHEKCDCIRTCDKADEERLSLDFVLLVIYFICFKLLLLLLSVIFGWSWSRCVVAVTIATTITALRTIVCFVVILF